MEGYLSSTVWRNLHRGQYKDCELNFLEWSLGSAIQWLTEKWLPTLTAVKLIQAESAVQLSDVDGSTGFPGGQSVSLWLTLKLFIIFKFCD